MNFQDIDLDALVKFISEITGRNFILDDRVKGKVTIISPGKISVDEAYAVFQSVLQVKGFTTVPSGAVLKVLPSQEAKSATVATILPGRPYAEGDEFVTQLIPLKNVDVNNILGIIQPLISANGLLAAYTSTNTMIIIDSASNIDRIIKILRELDVADKERGIDVVRLNYAFATEIAATLAQVLEEPGNAAPQVGTAARRPGAPNVPAAAAQAAGARRPGAPGAPGAPAQPIEGGTGAASYKIIPDERTNALILVAGPLQMRKIKDLIVRLDVPLPFGTGRIHVYYLRYANVYEITPILSDLVGGGQGFGGLGSGLLNRGLTGSAARRSGAVSSTGGFGGLGGGLGTGFAGQSGFGGGFGGGGFGGFGGGGFGGGNFGTGFSGGGALRGGSLAGPGFGGGIPGQGGVASITGGGNGEFEGLVRISGDPSTNALIINASAQDYETLKQVIVQLDVRRRQVYVEAIIMEVRLDTMRALGIELQGAAGTNNGVVFGRVDLQDLSAIAPLQPATSPFNLTGLIAAAASNQTIRLPNGTVIPAQIILLHASETNNDVNILSAPDILTTDNQEAEIVVGENVPFIASTSTSETNLGNTFNTVDRRDVGITLRITPQISEGGMVRMQVFEEVSALVMEALINSNQLGPVTTIRSATTSVVVHDKQTVVIGGLISDETDNTESSVPFLADIPVLGNFFRNTTGERKKINLLIFLTPHIIRSPAEHRDKSLEERDKLRSVMEEQGVKYKKRKYLDMPSWTPDIKEAPAEETTIGGASGDHAPQDHDKGGQIFEPKPLPPAGGSSTSPQDSGAQAAPPAAQTLAQRSAPSVRPSAEPEEEPPPPEGPYRYVLLAAFAEQGSPPPGLHSSSGLLAVELPQNSTLTTLFKPGQQYRFTSEKFDAYYRVLEAYPTAQEALNLYPEGMPVDPAKGDYLHWRKFGDPTSADVTAWTEVK
jgi:general secretion pathway protein D